jgi:sporulation protein YqfC
MTNTFAIPDMVSDAPRVTCLDAREVVVENVVGLLHVGTDEIRLDLGNLHLTLWGRDFEVNLVSGKEVHLTGDIVRMEFRRQGGGNR